MPPAWVGSLVLRLKESDKTVKVIAGNGWVRVRYRTGVIDRFWYLPTPAPRRYIGIDRGCAAAGEPIKISSLFGNDILTGRTEFQYYVIGRRAWGAANEVDRSLALQDLAEATCAAGYQGRLPMANVERDWERLRAYDGTACRAGQLIDFVPNRYGNRPGKKVLSHFFDIEKLPCSAQPLDLAARRPRAVCRAARRLAAAGKVISTFAIMAMLRRSCHPLIMFPHGYATLFGRIGAAAVYDKTPACGAKALACALMGIPYYTDRNAMFDAAMARGFGGFIGLDHRYADDGVGADVVVVADARDFHGGVEAVRAIDAGGRRMAVYVPGARRGEAQAALGPRAVVDVHIGFKHRGCFMVI